MIEFVNLTATHNVLAPVRCDVIIAGRSLDSDRFLRKATVPSADIHHCVHVAMADLPWVDEWSSDASRDPGSEVRSGA